MKIFWLLLFFCLTQLFSFAQSQDTIRYGNYFSKEAIKTDDYLLKIQVGTWIPIGNLSKRMDKRLNVGIWWGNVEEKGIKLNIGFNFCFPVSTQNEFDYYLPDTTLKIRSQEIGMFAIQASKPFAVYKKFAAEWVAGMGGHLISTNYEQPPNFQKNEGDNYGDITTILFCTGINIRHDRTGISLIYNLTPHNTISNHVEKHFGNQSLSVTTFYKF